MQSKLFAAVGFISLLLQAPASFGQVFEYVTTYGTVCHDEPTTSSYDTGNVSCQVTNENSGKSVDFSATGNCDPVMGSVTTMIPVCKQVAVVTPVPVIPPLEGCTGPFAGSGSSCGGNGD
jgi:hypothetical protein